MSVRSGPSKPRPLLPCLSHSVRSECDFSARASSQVKIPSGCQSVAQGPVRVRLLSPSPQPGHLVVTLGPLRPHATPLPQRGAPDLSFRVPLASRVARGDSDLRRRQLGGRCASRRPTRPERPRRLPLRVRRAPPGRGQAEPSGRAGSGWGRRPGSGWSPAPTTGGRCPRGPRDPRGLRSPAPAWSPAWVPGRPAPHSRWEATQEGPVLPTSGLAP